jgi:hypothetical protein
LIYLVSLYAKFAEHATDREKWIRNIPLLVLIYEGITTGNLDYDYAPNNTLISYKGTSSRKWINVSQEGRSAIEDLREKKLLNGLKLSTEDFQPITAYQVSPKGAELIAGIPSEMKEDIDNFVYPPAGKERKLLQVIFDGEKFILTNGSDYTKVSLITECEDVSYVSSPYLPACIRASDKPLDSNDHLKYECGKGESQIRDELSEAVVLSTAFCLVGEWIPFGCNQIVALNERLGALDRCQGGLFTAVIDEQPTSTQFKVAPGLTKVKILDFDYVHFINFQAEINFPEDSGVVQIENFGIHLNSDGTIIYGLYIDAIQEHTSEHIGIDTLTRLLVDVHSDSSKIMNDLLSQYQIQLLDMLYMGDVMMRSKFNCIISAGIEPKKSAEEYLDKGEMENELKQVLGDLRSAHDLSKDDVIIMGNSGILVSGPHAQFYESILITYLSLLCREIFMKNYFIRIFVLNKSLQNIREKIMGYRSDPNSIQTIRTAINAGTKDIILLKEILEYLEESLQEMEVPTTGVDSGAVRLLRVLDLKGMKNDTLTRCKDLTKLIEGANNELTTLGQMTEMIITNQLEEVFKNVDQNTKYLVDASAANERSSASLEVMQVILAGGFAFDIVDRITGGTLNTRVPEWAMDYIVYPIVQKPMLWFFLNLVWLFGICYGLTVIMAFLEAQTVGYVSIRIKLNKKINGSNLRKYLATKSLDVIDSIMEPGAQMKKYKWVEADKIFWEKAPPTVELVVDVANDYILIAYFLIDGKKTTMREKELLAKFDVVMSQNGVYKD